MNATERALYRGKDLVRGEWRFGYYWYGKATGAHIIMLPNSSAEVNPETVGQWTGLLDKEGKKIFEGDILRFDSFTPSVNKVIFDDGRFIAVRDNIGSCIESYYFNEEAIVIGNIHDNPKLLKEGE